MSTNIECFDVLTGRIFADLYDSFPIPLEIEQDSYCALLVKRVKPESEGDDVVGEYFDSIADAQEFVDATFQWLNNAGYIDYEALSFDAATAVLTAKGLESLKLVPDVLTGKSLGDSLVEAVNEGLMDQLKSLTGQAIGAGVKLGIGLIGS